jgi:membrane protein DedA with SNARE-associated domain
MDVIQQLWVQLQHNPVPHLGPASYIVLAILVGLEGPFATLAGGALAGSGRMSPQVVILIAIAANLTADLFWYSLGYSGKVTWLLPYARWFGIRPQHISQLQANMYLHAHRVLPFTKFGAGLAIPALIATGMARAPWQRWLPTLAVAEILRSAFLVMLGYTAATALGQASQGIRVVMAAVTLSFIIAIVVWLRRGRRPVPAFEEVQRKS